ENIIRHFFGSKIAHISLILTENKDAYVLKRAEKLGVSTHIFKMDELQNGCVKDILVAKGVDFIVLAGFLKLIPLNLIEAYPNRIVNIHPALLPKYGGKGMFGMRVHKAVLDAGEKESGITIHLVNENYDEGNIIFQAKCPVISCDDPEALAERIHSLEHEYYPIVIERFILG
ncbi:MAG: phosphoribosylglycinamide formyltransferase, partial [Bacteroidetes bacterium HGW-Bacteroidetes-15]